jgi:nucleotide-binding universal stress UspA family protein
MRVLIYVGRAPSRETVIGYSAPIVERAASSLTLVAAAGQEPLLQEAATRLRPAEGVPVALRAIGGDAHQAILAAASEHPHDLAVFGRLNRPLARILPGSRPRSRAIAQHLEPSVLRVIGPPRPLRRILLASAGGITAIHSARVVARLAAPLGAAVTLLHVLSQQSLFFEGFGDRRAGVAQFMAGEMSEVVTLREAAAVLRGAGVPVDLKGRAGPVIDEILAELRGGAYDLLAIGAHRVASALDRILLEDITGDLLDQSPLATLVVKGQG